MHSVLGGVGVQIFLCVGFGERKVSKLKGRETYYLPSLIAACITIHETHRSKFVENYCIND